MLTFRNADLETTRDTQTSFCWSDRAKDDTRLARRLKIKPPYIERDPEEEEDDLYWWENQEI